jgi:FXSXX-COOH protein
MNSMNDNDGLIDVSGLSLEELSATVDESGLGRALDQILAASKNSSGFHGFQNAI